MKDFHLVYSRNEEPLITFNDKIMIYVEASAVITGINMQMSEDRIFNEMKKYVNRLKIIITAAGGVYDKEYRLLFWHTILLDTVLKASHL